MQKVATRQACVLFTQETYKRKDVGEYKIPDIKSPEGAVLISSQFYEVDISETKQIYDKMYIDRTKANSGGKRLDKYISNIVEQLGDGATVDNLPWSSMRSWYKEITSPGSDSIGALYKENYVTPCNMGATYFDTEVLSRMYRWSLAATLSGGLGDDGKSQNFGSTWYNRRRFPYVDYRGFRIWLDDTTAISDIQYTLFNLNDPSQKEQFEQMTSIDKYAEDTGVSITKEDERNYVVVASVPYTASVSYTGITPLKHIINFANNHRVNGFKDGDLKGTSGPKDIGEIGKDFGKDKKRLTGSAGDPSSDYLYGKLDNRVTYYILK